MAKCDMPGCRASAKITLEFEDAQSSQPWRVCGWDYNHLNAVGSPDPKRSQKAIKELEQRGAPSQLIAQAHEWGGRTPAHPVDPERSRPGEAPGLPGLQPNEGMAQRLAESQARKLAAEQERSQQQERRDRHREREIDGRDL